LHLLFQVFIDILKLIKGLIGYYLIGASFLFSVLFLGFAKYCVTLNATWCVNSVCHFFGTRPFNKNIEARDNLFVSLVAMGEGWHNWFKII
jgi:stearoyl-CoA desaturase (delta-9 desaturase)